MNLLIQEPPLQVLPSLAVKIGLNEAMFLQQVHYWLLRSGQEIDGLKWVYNRVSDWQTQFPFWSEDTITRIVKSLRKSGLLVVERLSNDKRDTTNFYRVDYDLLARISDSEPASCGVHPADLQVSEPADCMSLLTENTTENCVSVSERRGDNEKLKTSKEKHPAIPQGFDDLIKLGVQAQHATDWLRVRKEKSAPTLSATALKKLVLEASRACLTVDDAVRIAAEKGWRGFEAAWLQDNQPTLPRTPPRSSPASENFKARDYGSGGKL